MLHWCTDQAMSEALSQMDLTASQGCVMGFLSHQDRPPCPRDVEEAFSMSHSCVAGILSRLEKKGFLEFRPDPADRRCKRIYILPKGRACSQRMRDTICGINDRMVRDFTPEEQAEFTRLLEQAICNMGGSPCKPFQKEESK